MKHIKKLPVYIIVFLGIVIGGIISIPVMIGIVIKATIPAILEKFREGL